MWVLNNSLPRPRCEKGATLTVRYADPLKGFRTRTKVQYGLWIRTRSTCAGLPRYFRTNGRGFRTKKRVSAQYLRKTSKNTEF
jgi:hypothetical protein